MCDPNLIPLFQKPARLTWLPIRKPRRLRDYWLLRATLRRTPFDALLCAQASLRTNLIYPLCSANKKVGFDTCRGREGHQWVTNDRIVYQDNHLIEGFAQFFAHIHYPLDLSALHWPLAVNAIPSPDSDALRAVQLPKQQAYLGLVLAASKPERTWPLEQQKAFLQLCATHFPHQIVFLGGASEAELALARHLHDWSQNQTQLRHRVINLTGKTSLLQLSAVIKQLDLLVSPDSGPAHLATAVGTAVVGLYAVARPELSGPYRSPFTVNAYPEAARLYLNQNHNTLHWHTRIHDKRAMSVITAETVLTHVEQALTMLPSV